MNEVLLLMMLTMTNAIQVSLDKDEKHSRPQTSLPVV